ncbi:unnamed protein product [Dicrocoelium dendriticum]|nr:unnamed protein product [Dicrocoelium dendriticum]
MPRRAKKSTGGAPRGSQYINGKLVHMATNQKLYFQTSVSTVFRETLKPQEQFSKNAAERVMERNLRKRQSRGTMNVLEDQFTLEKNKLGTRSPFRPYLYYREIEEIQRSKTKPEYFVLSVDSEKSGLKYYEVYKCKTADDAYKFEKYVRQAMEDPEDRIREGQALGVVPVENNPDMRRSLVYVDFQTSMESLEENDRRSGLYQPSRQSPTPVLQSKISVDGLR